MSTQENTKLGPETVKREIDVSVQDRLEKPLSKTSTLCARTASGVFEVPEESRRAFFARKPDERHEATLAAKDVAEAFSQAIRCSEDGQETQVAECSRVVALLIEAVKEQKVQIKNQEHSLKEQRAQVAKLRGEVERLKISLRATAVGR